MSEYTIEGDDSMRWDVIMEAPKEPVHSCDGCSGSGVYHGAGYVENGVFKGFTGTCFRCGGKGHQTESDRKRNWGYDRNRRFAP